MIINLNPRLEAALAAEAQRRGVAPEALALEALQARFLAPVPAFEPRDDWERRLLAIGIPRAVSLSNEALRREHTYD